jgi:hypothetical protein
MYNVIYWSVRAIIVAVETQNFSLFLLLKHVCAVRTAINIQNLRKEAKQRLLIIVALDISLP